MIAQHNMSKNRVMNAVLRQYMPEEIGNAELFTSDGFREIIESTVRGIGGMIPSAQQLRVLLKNAGPDAFVAYVENYTTVALNISNAFVKDAERKEAYRLLVALALHECGHRLFTDGEYYKGHTLRIAQSKELKNAPHVTAFLKKRPTAVGQVLKLLHGIQNSCEDGFIEFELMKLYEGYGEYLKEFRAKHLAEAPTYEKMVAEGYDKPAILFNVLLIYAKYSEIKVEDKAVLGTDPLLVAFQQLLPVIDEARFSKSFAKRVDAAERILDAFWVLIGAQAQGEKSSKPDQRKGQNPSSSGYSEGSGSSDSDEEGSSNADEDGDRGNSSDDSNNGENEPASTSEEESEPLSEEELAELLKDETPEDRGSSDEDEGSDNESASSPDGEEGDSDTVSESASTPSEEDEGEPLTEEELVELLKAATAAADETPEDGSQEGSSLMSAVSDAPDGENSSTGSTNGEDPMASEGEGASGEDAARSDKQMLENLENQIREQKAREKAQAQEDRARDKEVKSFDLTSLHKGIHWNIVDVQEGSSPETAQLEESVRPVYGRLCREFSRQIKDRLEYSWQKGEYTGKKFSDTYRLDLRHASRRIVPQDDFDMCVGLVIDMSGSMDGACIDAATETAAVLAQFCNELNIPLCIYGHAHSGARIWRIKEFASYDGKELQRIAGARSACNGGTRDGISLRVMAESLARRPEKVKLLFTVCDGVPCATGYGYWRGASPKASPAKADINDILTTYGRKGVKFITAGLGSCMDDIRPLWTDYVPSTYLPKLLEIDDLTEMSKKFVSIVKKWID